MCILSLSSFSKRAGRVTWERSPCSAERHVRVHGTQHRGACALAAPSPVGPTRGSRLRVRPG
eukprot:3889599-Pleurochrysis_carterae.AAC.1